MAAAVEDKFSYVLRVETNEPAYAVESRTFPVVVTSVRILDFSTIGIHEKYMTEIICNESKINALSSATGTL
jgi:hypothetical protein